MMMDSSNAMNLIINTSIKLGGELAKDTLLLTLKAIEHHKQNKKGIIAMKQLLNSNESIGVLNLNKSDLKEFKAKCKKAHIQFGTISNGDKTKVFYKVSNAEIIKDVLSDILQKEKESKINEVKDKINTKIKNNNKVANKIDEISENNTAVETDNNNAVVNKADDVAETNAYKTIEERLDFESVNDDHYRYQLTSTTNEEAMKYKEELEKEGIKTDVIFLKVNDDNTFNVALRVNKKDKDKVKDIIENKDRDKDKGKERLNELIDKAESNRRQIAINKAMEKSKSKKREVER